MQASDYLSRSWRSRNNTFRGELKGPNLNLGGDTNRFLLRTRLTPLVEAIHLQGRRGGEPSSCRALLYNTTSFESLGTEPAMLKVAKKVLFVNLSLRSETHDSEHLLT